MDIYVLRCKYLFIQISIVDVNPSLDFACIASIWKYCVGNLLSLQSYFFLESLFAYYMIFIYDIYMVFISDVRVIDG